MLTFAIAPSPKWYFLDLTGRPAAGGSMYFTSTLDHTTPKFVFSDPAGLFPYTDPIILDATGGSPVPMYFDVTTAGLYYMVVKDAQGNIIFTLDKFPISGSGGVTPITTTLDIENHIVNGQFAFIEAKSAADSEIHPTAGVNHRMAPAAGFFKDQAGNYVKSLHGSDCGWIFRKEGGAGETSTIKFVDVTAIGEGFPNSPSANAPVYFEYELVIAGAPQTAAFFEQVIPNVESFSNELLTISFDTNASVAGIGSLEIFQFYGTGGTPSASTSISQIFNFAVGGWARQSIQITAPSVATKVLGTNNNDYLSVRWNFPLDVIGKFNLDCCQVQRGNIPLSPYIYQTYNQDQGKILIDILTKVP
jgi:hypothetical protein